MPLSFDAIENARDLGGIKTRDGRTVRHGLLLRCGNLSRATDPDIETLRRDFHLSDIVDFRFDAEAAKDPDREIPGVRHTQLSTLSQKLIDGFSQGKDRAGLAAAFLLGALGADRQAIVDDFDQSSACFAMPIAMLSGKVREMGGDQAALDFIQAMVGVSTENFERSLDLIDRKYGSLDDYIANQLGFTQEESQRLRAKYLQ